MQDYLPENNNHMIQKRKEKRKKKYKQLFWRHYSDPHLGL